MWHLAIHLPSCVHAHLRTCLLAYLLTALLACLLLTTHYLLPTSPLQGPKKLGKAKVPPTPTRDPASVRLLNLYNAAEPEHPPAAAGQKR